MRQRATSMSMFGESGAAMIKSEQWENLIIQFSGQAYENNCVTIGGGVHDGIKPFINVGFVADFDFMNRSVWIVFIKMLAKTIQAHLANLSNCFLLAVPDHKRGDQILASKSSIHDQDGNAVDCGEDCANDVQDDAPVVITESEKGIGFRNERQVIDGPQIAANFEVLGDREIIEYGE